MKKKITTIFIVLAIFFSLMTSTTFAATNGTTASKNHGAIDNMQVILKRPLTVLENQTGVYDPFGSAFYEDGATIRISFSSGEVIDYVCSLIVGQGRAYRSSNGEELLWNNLTTKDDQSSNPWKAGNTYKFDLRLQFDQNSFGECPMYITVIKNDIKKIESEFTESSPLVLNEFGGGIISTFADGTLFYDYDATIKKEFYSEGRTLKVTKTDGSKVTYTCKNVSGYGMCFINEQGEVLTGCNVGGLNQHWWTPSEEILYIAYISMEYKDFGNVKIKMVKNPKNAYSVNSNVTLNGNTAAISLDSSGKKSLDFAKGKKVSIIDVIADTQTAGDISGSFSTSDLKNISETLGAGFSITTSTANISIDKTALESIVKAGSGATTEITVSQDVAIPLNASNSLTKDNAMVVSLSVKNGNNEVTNFGGGKVTVQVPIPERLLGKPLECVCLNEKDKLVAMPGSVVTIEGKKYFSFTTTHFSDFALVDTTQVEVDNTAAKILQTSIKKAKTIAVKGGIKLTWSKATNSKITKYQVYRATSKTGTYKLVKTTSSTSFKNTGLKKGKRYYYKVRGYAVINGEKVYTKYSSIVSRKV